MDEVQTLVKKRHEERKATDAVYKRFGLSRGELVPTAEPWRFVHWTWLDQARRTYVEFEGGHNVFVCETDVKDPDYVVTTHEGEYGSCWHYILKKKYQKPDYEKPCKYLVVFREDNEVKWAAPFTLFKDAEDYAIQEAEAYLLSHDEELKSEPFIGLGPHTFLEYLQERSTELYRPGATNICIVQVAYREEHYP